jgi:hypothetical protein
MGRKKIQLSAKLIALKLFRKRLYLSRESLVETSTERKRESERKRERERERKEGKHPHLVISSPAR